MNNAGAVLSGIGIGSALMFFMDPHRGSDRREVVRDKVSGAKDAIGSVRDRVTGRRRGFPLMREDWPAAWRVAMGAVGGSLAVYGFSRHNPWWSAAGAAGATLLARGITNREIRRGFGIMRAA